MLIALLTLGVNLTAIVTLLTESSYGFVQPGADGLPE